MTITLVQCKSTGHPNSTQTFKITDNSWKIFKCFSTETPESNFHEDVKRLLPIDRKKAQILFVQLGKRCESGQNLSFFYDKKALHDALEFSYTDVSGATVIDKIWRIRQGDLRLYFIYFPPGKRLVLLNIWVKKQDKLTASEENSLSNLAEKVMKSGL